VVNLSEKIGIILIFIIIGIQSHLQNISALTVSHNLAPPHPPDLRRLRHLEACPYLKKEIADFFFIVFSSLLSTRPGSASRVMRKQINTYFQDPISK
jgi:hypothetical protein